MTTTSLPAAGSQVLAMLPSQNPSTPDLACPALGTLLVGAAGELATVRLTSGRVVTLPRQQVMPGG